MGKIKEGSGKKDQGGWNKAQGFTRKVESMEVRKEMSSSFNPSLSFFCNLAWFVVVFMYFIGLSKPKPIARTFSESPENYSGNKFSPLDFAPVIFRLTGYLS